LDSIIASIAIVISLHYESSRNDGKVKYNILLIDDELDITLTLKGVLEGAGFKVDSYTDPLLALNNYKINFYDLVILDIKMPKMDGFQLYTKIREKDPKVKVCFLTASEFYYEEFRKKHSYDSVKLLDNEYFIQKPIKNEELIKRITYVINKK
jgi:DNA-binding response OmpR family regulator